MTQMPQNQIPADAVAELRRTVAGRVSYPAGPAYAELCGGHNLAVVHRPAAVVEASGEADVAAALAVATSYALPVHVQATGHGATRARTGGLLVLTRALDAVSVDPVARTATVGAGATWRALLDAAESHGLAPVSTNGAGVGVVGSLLGGGLGPQARRHGLSSDHVVRLRVATADGVVRDVDAGSDLGWAMLGGRDGLGVVTALTVSLTGTPDVWGGERVVLGPGLRAALGDWHAWSRELPPECTTSAMLATLPDLDELPPPLRGQHVLRLTVCDTDPAAAPRTQAGGPFLTDGPADAVRVVGELSAAEWVRRHGDPDRAMPVWQRGFLLSDLTEDVLEDLVQLAAPPAPLMGLEIRVLGGAVARPARHAADASAARYLVNLIGAPVPELFDAVVPAHAERVEQVLRPWLVPGVLPNFAGVPDASHRTEAGWPVEVAARVAAQRAAHDPAGVLAAIRPEGVPA